MQLDRNDEFGWFFRLIPLVGIPMVVAYLWLKPAPPQPLPNSAVFGCYATPGSPSIRLDATGMHVIQSGFPRIRYHLERLKLGIALTADAPIRADRVGATYRYGIDRHGQGLFLPFYRVEDGHTYGVFDPALLARFQMLATDGARLSYARSNNVACTPV